MRNPVKLAASAKGPLALLRRTSRIMQRYGWTATAMDQMLSQFVRTLKQFDCGATFPTTAVVVERRPYVLEKYQAQGIEFAVHGYTHIDYSELVPEQQLAHLHRARQALAKAGITATGFRSPYLRCESDLYTIIEAAGFSYASSQPIMWDMLDVNGLALSSYAGFKRAVDFYAPWDASKQLSLPRFCGTIVEIPVSLPDDEMLLDRLGGETRGLVGKAWQHILAQTYQGGELFTIQLHPERIALCTHDLSVVLAEARTLTPPVWLARLDQIASWWRERATADVEVTEIGDGAWRLSVVGPPGVTILARRVEVLGPAQPWTDGYWQVPSTTCVVRAARQPVIGVSPACPLALNTFLRQQGYVCQVSDEAQEYSVYLDKADFAPEDEQHLLAEIEKSAGPLVRLGRWPDGARSALCVTGDIDALTLWDYGLRVFGR